jgi:hypothetical protein
LDSVNAPDVLGKKTSAVTRPGPVGCGTFYAFPALAKGADFRLGSKADVMRSNRDVRFYPKSRHCPQLTLPAWPENFPVRQEKFPAVDLKIPCSLA